jgi:hypothetical protein
MTDQTCKHFWKIESPDGPTSTGRCKLCGEKREFNNSYEYTGWRMSIKSRLQKKRSATKARSDGQAATK